jgi:hypothetical protein
VLRFCPHGGRPPCWAAPPDNNSSNTSWFNAEQGGISSINIETQCVTPEPGVYGLTAALGGLALVLRKRS